MPKIAVLSPSLELRLSAISAGSQSTSSASACFVAGSRESSADHMFTSGLRPMKRSASIVACSTTLGGGLTAALLRLSSGSWSG